MISFLGITAHWYQDGDIHHIILDFIKYIVCLLYRHLLNLTHTFFLFRLDKAHTGAYLAERLNECLRSYGLEDRVRPPMHVLHMHLADV